MILIYIFIYWQLLSIVELNVQGSLFIYLIFIQSSTQAGLGQITRSCYSDGRNRVKNRLKLAITEHWHYNSITLPFGA